MERAGRRLAVEQGVDGDRVGVRVRRLDPEFAKVGEFLVQPLAAADREPARREAVALAAAEEAEIARAQERHDLVPDVRGVDRKFQAEARKAEVDRHVGGELVAPVVEEVRRIGDRRRDAVAQHVDHDGTLVEVAEVEEFEPEVGVELLAEQGLLGLEADVAPGVVIEIGEAVGQRRHVRVIGGGGEVARALHHVLIAERRRRAALRSVALGEGGLDHGRAGKHGCADDERAAAEFGHGGNIRQENKRGGRGSALPGRKQQDRRAQ